MYFMTDVLSKIRAALVTAENYLVQHTGMLPTYPFELDG